MDAQMTSRAAGAPVAAVQLTGIATSSVAQGRTGSSAKGAEAAAMQAGQQLPNERGMTISGDFRYFDVIFCCIQSPSTTARTSLLTAVQLQTV